MLRLSRNDIEDIGVSILRDYAARIVNDEHIPVDIDAFARKYLGLQIQYRSLSDNGSILGITIYKDVQVDMTLRNHNIVISATEDTILLDEQLYKPENKRRERFTIAHECAHHILARIEERQTGVSFRKAFNPGEVYSFHELDSAEAWCEWQANTLGAALLMPRLELLKMLRRGFPPYHLTMYGNRFNRWDYLKVKSLSNNFNVSMSAMTLRLKDLGFINRKPESEYRNPIDIFVS